MKSNIPVIPVILLFVVGLCLAAIVHLVFENKRLKKILQDLKKHNTFPRLHERKFTQDTYGGFRNKEKDHG